MPDSSLDKYGDKALKEEEREKAEELRAAKNRGTSESVYGPLALAGEGDREAVEAAAEHGDMEVPQAAEEALEGAEGESPEESQETSESGGETLEEALAGLEIESGELPEGYEMEHQGGGYYSVTDPDGERVENPDRDSGNWAGKEMAVTAAWYDADQREGEEAAPEDDESEGYSLATDEQTSVEKLKEILEAEPSMIDNRMHAEFAREDGPRLEALDALLESERDNQNRENVVQTLISAKQDVTPEGEE